MRSNILSLAKPRGLCVICNTQILVGRSSSKVCSDECRKVLRKQTSRAYSSKYYEDNKQAEKLRSKKFRLSNLEYIKLKQRSDKRQRKLEAIEYKGGRCENCGGQFHPAVYDFHHIDTSTKDRDPSKMLQLSWKRVTNELDKCKMLCANCHRLEHHNKEVPDGAKT